MSLTVTTDYQRKFFLHTWDDVQKDLKLTHFVSLGEFKSIIKAKWDHVIATDWILFVSSVLGVTILLLRCCIGQVTLRKDFKSQWCWDGVK